MRKPRELQEGARYHVTARANRKEMLLDSKRSKLLFLNVVKRAKAKYAFRIENFTIMGSHFHFVIVPGRGQSLSSIMQWILSVFAMAYNRIHAYTGHVWGERFFSRIIQGLHDLIAVFEYIDGNPVIAKQVADRRVWRYGGLWHCRSGCHDVVDKDPLWIKLIFPERDILSIA